MILCNSWLSHSLSYQKLLGFVIRKMSLSANILNGLMWQLSECKWQRKRMDAMNNVENHDVEAILMHHPFWYLIEFYHLIIISIFHAIKRVCMRNLNSQTFSLQVISSSKYLRKVNSSKYIIRIVSVKIHQYRLEITPTKWSQQCNF